MSRLDEDLQRRISDALLSDDDGLGDLVEGDADAALYASDLQAIDEALGGLAPRGGGAEPDWEAMAARIDARLGSDEALEDIGDVTRAPEFEEEPAPVVQLPAVAAAAPEPGAEVVSLDAARKRRNRIFAAVGGLAAAAAVGLGIMSGLTLGGADEAAPASMAAEQEMAPAAEAVATGTMDGPGEPSDWAGAADEAAAEGEAPSEVAAVAAAAPAAEPAMEMPATSRSALENRAARGRAGGGYPVDDLLAEPMARSRRRRAGRRGSGASLGASGGGGGGIARPAPAPARTSTGSTTAATRVLAVNALNARISQVQRCIGTEGETAPVVVTVDANGRLLNVNVGGTLTDQARACVAREVRLARMPRSDEGSYSLTHTYRPAPVAGGSLSGSGNAARRTRRRSARTPANPAARDMMMEAADPAPTP